MRPESGRRALSTLCIGLLVVGSSALACDVRVLQGRSDELLLSVHMGDIRQLDLTYLHSVTRTEVRETLALDASGFTQQRIEFLEHGPGLPTETLRGERFVRFGDRFVYDNMQRRLGDLHMRVDPTQFQTLKVGGVTYPLSRWGRQSLKLLVHDCD